ncbi:MAG: hypothetical protein CTY10_10075 [Methylotenera sp.]|nr:MAG: hypothetical protein CTY10_10075 [Methylotenera sp.]
MTVDKILVRLLQAATGILLLFVATAASAVEVALSAETASVLDYLTDKDGRYTGPTVEDKIAKMDTDKNGFADVFEVRAYLVALHGSEYQKDLLDKWEASASGKSCSTPFAKELYTDKTY